MLHFARYLGKLYHIRWSKGNNRINLISAADKTKVDHPQARMLTPEKIVTIVGDLQKPLGHDKVWDPKAQVTRMHCQQDGLYTLSGILPAGKYEYKVAINGNWVENYGLDGKPGGTNITLILEHQQQVTFYYSDLSKRITDSTKYELLSELRLPRVEGKLAEVVGAPLRLNDPNLDNVYSVVFQLPPGTYPFEIHFAGRIFPSSITIGNQVNQGRILFDRSTNRVFVDDGRLAAAQPWHDTFDLRLREPFEAIPTKVPITLRLQTRHNSVKQPKLLIGQGRITTLGVQFGEYDSTYPMMLKKEGDGSDSAGLDIWEISLPFESPGIYGYKFLLDEFAQYGDDSLAGGTGIGSLQQTEYFRITVYDHKFETPEWMKGAIIYQIIPDRFCNGNPTNDHSRSQGRAGKPLKWKKWSSIPTDPANEYFGGDLEGIQQRLDYLQSLGVSVIYLTPILNAGSYHRYDFVNFLEIDPLLGGDDKLFLLVKELKNRKMHLVLDGVFGHTGDDSIYFNRYGRHPWVGAYDYWSKVYDKVNHGQSLETAKASTKMELLAQGMVFSPYEWHNWFTILNEHSGSDPSSPYRYHAFSGFDSLPEFRRELTELKPYMNYVLYDPNSVVKQWHNWGISGWRLDAAPHLGHLFPKEFRKVLKELRLSTGGYPVIMAEMFDDASTHFLGDEFDSVMNYPFANAVMDQFLLNGNAAMACHSLTKLRQNYPPQVLAVLMNLLDSHDTERAIYHLGEGTDTGPATKGKNFSYDLGKRRLKLAVAFQMGYPGAPSIYYGDEAGLFGAGDPDNRRAYPWGREDRELLSYYRKIIGIRTQYHDLFKQGKLVELIAKENTYVYLRQLGDQVAVIAINRGKQSVDLTVTLGREGISDRLQLIDTLHPAYGVRPQRGLLSFKIPPLSARWLIGQENLPTEARLPTFQQKLFDSHSINNVQLLGTANARRGRWNPYLSENDMLNDSFNKEGFVKSIYLHPRGGRNADGIYAIRFTVNHDLGKVYKLDRVRGAPHLVTGEESQSSPNVIFKVTKPMEYTIHFNPENATFSISPEVLFLDQVQSMQINGFVHDKEQGDFETYNRHRTFPCQKWDETQFNHEMSYLGNNIWEKKLFLVKKGGMEKRQDGIYQFLFSANHNADWGFCAINGQPGKLAEGSGYDSKTGNLIDSDIVIKIVKDDLYTIRMNPKEHWFTVDPPVEILNSIKSCQINGPVVANSWDPSDPSHEMDKSDNPLWHKTIYLSSNGGPGKNGIYSCNISINNEWLLDSLGFGAWITSDDKASIRAKIWHTKPQEPNFLFQVTQSGFYTFLFDAATQTLTISPSVERVIGIKMLKVVGDIYDDASKQWNPYLVEGEMTTQDGILFRKEIMLQANKTYQYKYTVNNAGFLWAFGDYIYDGYKELSTHGDPPALEFSPNRSGVYIFEANIGTGGYNVLPKFKE